MAVTGSRVPADDGMVGVALGEEGDPAFEAVRRTAVERAVRHGLLRDGAAAAAVVAEAAAAGVVPVDGRVMAHRKAGLFYLLAPGAAGGVDLVAPTAEELATAAGELAAAWDADHLAYMRAVDAGTDVTLESGWLQTLLARSLARDAVAIASGRPLAPRVDPARDALAARLLEEALDAAREDGALPSAALH